ncbi:MAG: plasmid pRiA4b ORF-3 family protein [Deltaproteobacteria bacterium]|jgi:hypothetical protein|nr:plasmid pRiA4b ORF-3 family protein [Deltaproteobacteria bacterium]
MANKKTPQVTLDKSPASDQAAETKTTPKKKTPVSGLKTGSKATAVKAAPPRRVPLYAFSIELKDIKPRIWRKFFVPSNISLQEFNEVIFTVMGWDGYHLSIFNIGGEQYGDTEDDDDFLFSKRAKSLSKKLNKLGLGKGSRFTYEYDFGDGWVHSIKLLDMDFESNRPALKYGCYDGARACPPEDCGGPFGYMEMLEILADPNHEEYETMAEMVGEDFDPEAFDKVMLTEILNNK